MPDALTIALAVALVAVFVVTVALAIGMTAREIRDERRAKGRTIEVMPASDREFKVGVREGRR